MSERDGSRELERCKGARVKVGGGPWSSGQPEWASWSLQKEGGSDNDFSSVGPPFVAVMAFTHQAARALSETVDLRST